MTIQDPQRELPRGFRGGADAWDSDAGTIVAADYFSAPSSGPGVLYYVIGPSAGWTDPNAAEIIAGTLAGGATATASGNEPASATDPMFDWGTLATGIGAGTYRIAFVWTDGVTPNAVAVSDPWTIGSIPADALWLSALGQRVRAGSAGVNRRLYLMPTGGLVASLTLPVGGMPLRINAAGAYLTSPA